MTDPGRWESAHPTLAYGSSKPALVALTVHYAKAFPGIRSNAADPGYTATDLDGHRATQVVTEGADASVAYATIGSDSPTGGFFDRHGGVP
jgi:NAD(P)-dependent dehydrogenase (short-subunit alcohol dehydrogenase family)